MSPEGGLDYRGRPLAFRTTVAVSVVAGVKYAPIPSERVPDTILLTFQDVQVPTGRIA